ncbi:uncharacterized protein LY79DRAFT_573123 [Colletotrichum navitas]|uniref:Uncharacterized protein n=1 Tax=Colletotrichum navitas TaxID=681940 RepID=A0AAD8PJZ5_9PEZI|nr:uncharacterized protein LY79DRAFT_573123 [Colletotrichum navitas]KAK1565914.1 hypothetical protein LY79DRAFT_573123 [Colletotrichum navitas]
MPYLSSIGFSNSEVTWVLMAAPLAGLLLPLIVASISDGSRRWPILGSGLGVIVALLCLAWAQEASALFLGALRLDSPIAVVTGGKLVAVVAIYLLNIAMQPLHISLRALLMDVCPPQQQATASLWITRLSSSGSVLGTGFAFFTEPSFKILSLICCAAMCLLLGIHTLRALEYYAKQREEMSGRSEVNKAWNLRSMVSKMRRIVKKSMRLPEVTRIVCRTQMWSWLAWFPVLFYMTTAVSETYKRASAKLGRFHVDKTEAEVASAGCMLVFHSVVLVTTVLMQSLSGTALSRKAMAASASSHECTASERKKGLYLLEAQNRRLFKVWSLALTTTAGTLAVAVTSVLGGVDKAAPLVLSSLGVQFAISNWIPYGIIATDLAVNASGPEADADGGKLDDAAAILAIHNGAICLPQIASAVACGLFFRINESIGLVMDVFWVFLLVTPVLLMAAYGSWPCTRSMGGI